MFITQGNLNEIQKHFPDLYLSDDGSMITGEISFSAFFDGSLLHRNPVGMEEAKVFRGCYEIAVHLQEMSRYGFPNVYEIGGRIQRVADESGIAVTDLHVNFDKTCCLSIFTNNEAANMSPVVYFLEVIFSFFAWQAYFEKYEKKAPWGDYSHYSQGELEHQKELDQRMKASGRNDLCPCGSSRKFKHCCLETFSARMRSNRQCL